MNAIRRLAAAVIFALAATSPVAAGEPAPTTGRALATLAQIPLTSRDGTRLLLGSRIAPGKPTLISIWASWCPPCITEAPYLNKLRKELGGKYNFVYINRRDGNPDPTQPAASIAHFLARGGMADVDYVIADVAAYRQIVGKDLGNVPDGKVGIPRVYLFDREGRQIHTAYGFVRGDGPALEQRVKQAIAK